MKIEARIVGEEHRDPQFIELTPGQSIKLTACEEGGFTIEGPFDRNFYTHPVFDYDSSKRLALLGPDKMEEVRLSGTKHRVLSALMDQTSSLVEKKVLYEKGWPKYSPDDPQLPGYLRLYIGYLKDDLGIADYLQSVYGQGYILKNPLMS